MNADERKAWGPVIRVARQAAGLTSEELAQYAQTTRQTIGAIENGRSAPQEQVLLRVLDVLGLRAVTSEPDVEAFLGSIRPLLQRIDRTERQTVMMSVLRIVADALNDEQDDDFDPEAWVDRWLANRQDGPWQLELEWQPRPDAPRFDLAILNRDGKIAGVIEVKRGNPDPVATNQVLHQIESYFGLATVRNIAADQPSVDVMWIPKTVRFPEVANQFQQAFRGRMLDRQAAALQAWSDHLDGDDEAMAGVQAEQGAGAVQAALGEAWDAPRRRRRTDAEASAILREAKELLARRRTGDVDMSPERAIREASEIVRLSRTQEMQQLEDVAARSERVPDLTDPEDVEKWLDED